MAIENLEEVVMSHDASFLCIPFLPRSLKQIFKQVSDFIIRAATTMQEPRQKNANVELRFFSQHDRKVFAWISLFLMYFP